MPDSQFPSNYRRPTSADMDREQASEAGEDDVTPPVGGSRRISPTALSRTSQCLLRGLWAVQGVKGIGVSPFTQATFDDGKAFEKVLLAPEKKKSGFGR